MSYSTNLISIIGAVISFIIGTCYYQISIYQIGLYFTGIILGLGCITSGIFGYIGYRQQKKDPSIGIAVGVMIIAPIYYAFYHTIIFWMTLFMIHYSLMLTNFLINKFYEKLFGFYFD